VQFYWLALAVLALWRVTHLLNAEDGPWGAVAWLRGRAGDRFWGQLLDCFYCLSLWLAVPFAFLVGEGWKEWFLLWLALSAGSILLERWSAVGPSVLYAEDQRDGLLREDAAAVSERGAAATDRDGTSD
jgi:hypothetical protein